MTAEGLGLVVARRSAIFKMNAARHPARWCKINAVVLGDRTGIVGEEAYGAYLPGSVIAHHAPATVRLCRDAADTMRAVVAHGAIPGGVLGMDGLKEEDGEAKLEDPHIQRGFLPSILINRKCEITAAFNVGKEL